MSRADTLALRLLAYERTVAEMPGWVHASWYEQLGLRQAPQGRDGAMRLASALGVGVPQASAFDQPAHSVAVLPRPLLCRVLRARALLRRRPALRRCVDDALRRRLMNWLHPAVFSAVLRIPADARGRDVDGLPWPVLAGAGAPVDPLAWEGFCLFQAEGVWTDPALQCLLRLAFPMTLTPAADLAAFPGLACGGAWVLERLDAFVPEAPWLSG